MIAPSCRRVIISPQDRAGHCALQRDAVGMSAATGAEGGAGGGLGGSGFVDPM